MNPSRSARLIAWPQSLAAPPRTTRPFKSSIPMCVVPVTTAPPRRVLSSNSGHDTGHFAIVAVRRKAVMTERLDRSLMDLVSLHQETQRDAGLGLSLLEE